MEHIGIDLGSRTSHICVYDDQANQTTDERVVRTQDLERWLSKRACSRVVMETCTEAFAIADRAKDAGHEVRVVPSSLVRQLGVGQRKVKNDRRDAQVLAVASGRNGDSLPHVHVPSSDSRQLRRVLAARSSLVSCRTKQVTAAKSLLRQELVLLPTGTTAVFPQRARTALDGSTLLNVVEPMLQAIESLTQSIALCDQQVEALCADDAQVKLLKTVPGIGPVIAAMVLAVIDEPERFDKGAHLASYVGLTPGENTTGGKRRLTGITRAGQGQMRTLLIQACWTLIRTMPDCALAKRYARMSLHKPKQVAIVATARKLCVVIHAMLHKSQPFNPTLGAATPKGTEAQASVQEQLVDALRT